MSATPKRDDRALFWRILRNDLRIYWRGNAAKKAAWTTSTVARIGFVVLLHFIVWSMFAAYGPGTRGGPEFVCLVVVLLLGMSTLHRSLEVLYNRGDLALLLASPVPPRVVLLTRLTDVTVTSLLDTLAFVLPMANIAMLMFGWQWAWAFAAWLGVVLTMVPLAVLVTIVAVERIGARRARTVLQVLGLLFGMVAFVVTQLPQYMQSGASRDERSAARDSIRRDMFAWFEVPPLQQLAAAASGAWQWLLPLGLLGAGLFFLAQRTLAVRFTQGAQGAAGDVGGGGQGRTVALGAAWRHAFERPHDRTLVRTQLLLLRRDPLLLMRCAMQVVSLLPMLFVAFMAKAAAGFGGVGMLAAMIVPMQLAGLRNANDEANEFEAASPLRPRQRAWMRTTAAAMPFVVFAWLMAAVVAALAGPWPALMVAVGGPVLAFSGGWLGTCTTRTHTAEERSRNKPPRVVWQMLLGMFVGGLGAGGVGAVMSPYPLLGWVLFAIALLIAGLLFRIAPRPAVDGEG